MATRKPTPSELTAEWTVHAELKIHRPNEDGSDPGGQPMTYVYKWSSEDGKFVDKGETTSGSTRVPFTTTTASFASPPSDSGVSGSHKVSSANPKCTSTCSIVLTACTDLLPPPPTVVVHDDQMTFNTTQTFNVSPPEVPLTKDIFNRIDAWCQTSDCEVIYKKDRLVPEERDRQRIYSIRRRTDPLPLAEEEKALSPPSKLSRSANIFSPPSSASRHSSGAKDKKKPPRTVHIDVYCTGSDAESESSHKASPASEPSPTDEHSTLVTPQTVYESEELHLRHKRAGQHEVPRKLASLQGDLRKSGTREEINESKQMLLQKHVDDHRQVRRFNALHSRLNPFRRDPSEDAISSNYPTSSHSTMRDFTCSSISSALASSSAVFDEMDAAIKEEEPMPEIRFDTSPYWTSKAFNSPEVERKFLNEQRRIEEFFRPPYTPPAPIQLSKPSSPPPARIVAAISPQPPYARKANASSKSLDASHTTESTVKSPPRQLRLEMSPGGESQSSTLASHLSGYTDEHLSKARRFGRVIGALRKPGHHVGPARNPDCQCEHCRRWAEEKSQQQGGRGRCFSLGDVPLGFWFRRKRREE